MMKSCHSCLLLSELLVKDSGDITGELSVGEERCGSGEQPMTVH